MFPTILKIRLLQSLRIIQNIGWLRMLAFIICVVPFLIRYFAETWYLLIVSSLFLGLIHFVRTDKNFIKILQLSVYQVYAIEYSIFLLPVWIFLLIKQEFLYLGGSIVIATIISAIPYTIQQQNRPLLFVSRWIPAISFEWKSGFRQHFPFIAIFYSLGIGLAMYEIAIPLIIMCFSLLTACFYLESEPITMLKIFVKTPKQLLLHKVRWQLQLFWLLMLPFILLFLIFHTTYWYIILYLLITTSLAQIFAICYKYAVYYPNTKNQLNVFIYVVFGLAFMLVILTPFLVPVGIFIMVRYYQKAIKNLDLYCE